MPLYTLSPSHTLTLACPRTSHAVTLAVACPHTPSHLRTPLPSHALPPPLSHAQAHVEIGPQEPIGSSRWSQEAPKPNRTMEGLLIEPNTMGYVLCKAQVEDSVDSKR